MGESPIHKCLKSGNYQSINNFLQMIKNDPIGIHSRAIISVLNLIVSAELPALNEYLTSRIKQTEILTRIKRGTLKCRYGINYAVDVCE
jgi:hypothetical protein